MKDIFEFGPGRAEGFAEGKQVLGVEPGPTRTRRT